MVEKVWLRALEWELSDSDGGDAIYHITEELGSGSSGLVFKAVQTNNIMGQIIETVAIEVGIISSQEIIVLRARDELIGNLQSLPMWLWREDNCLSALL